MSARAANREPSAAEVASEMVSLIATMTVLARKIAAMEQTRVVTQAEENHALLLPELIRRLGLSQSSIQREVWKGRLTRLPGRRFRVALSEVERYLQEEKHR